jgi:hypothetical protein
VKPRIENPAGAPAASPDSTPTAPCAVSGRDGRGCASMKRAILHVTCHFTACIARERNRLTVQRCEPIDPRWTQRILGFIQNGKKAIAVHHFKRMARSIGVCANVVCQLRSGVLLRFEPAGEKDWNNRKSRKTQKTPVCAI